MGNSIEKDNVCSRLTKERIFRKNEIPFGDVRKYYLAMKAGTVVLFALLFYISFAAVFARTEYKEQISDMLIATMLLFSIASIIGHYSRTILGYGITAVSSVVVFICLQYSNGVGIVFDTGSLSYGEYFIKGIQSMAFWVILSKVLAVLHLALSIVFIISTIKVTEEPPATGMNVKIQRFQEWLSTNNDSLEDGRRPLDYWFAAASILLYMGYIAADRTMLLYDYFSLALFVAGMVLIASRKTLIGAFCCCCSALLRCNLYQYRFGYILPVIVAYLGMWLAILYLAFASAKKRRKVVLYEGRTSVLLNDILMWGAVAVGVLCFSFHQILGDFVHETLFFMGVKDNLPIFFFVPIISVLLARSRQWYGYFCASALYLFLWNTFRQIPDNSADNPLLDCIGTCQQYTEGVLHSATSYMKIITMASSVLCFICGVVTVVLMIRRRRHGSEEQSLG